MMNDWPSVLVRRSAVRRAIVSVTPPAPYGTTTFTGRIGHGWLYPGVAKPASAAQAAAMAASCFKFIVVSFAGADALLSPNQAKPGPAILAGSTAECTPTDRPANAHLAPE